MTEAFMVKKLQDATARITIADMDKFTFTWEQENQIKEVLKGETQDEVFMVLRVAVAIAHLRGIESGVMPQECFDMALKLPDNNHN